MCTVITALGLWSDAPLVVAANRDERLDRPSEAPARRDWGDLGILAPRDVVAGGTWWGINAAGLFVAITNRFGAAPDPRRRSRGQVVVDALRMGRIEDAVDGAMAYEADEHNPFHLMLAAGPGTPAAGGAAPRAHLVWSDGRRMRTEVLSSGVHVVTERSLGAGDGAREDLVGELVAPWAAQSLAPSDVELEAVLEHRDPDPWRSVSVRVPSLGYGTRSSTIARLGPRPRLRHSDEPPGSSTGERTWVDYSAALAGLDAKSG